MDELPVLRRLIAHFKLPPVLAHACAYATPQSDARWEMVNTLGPEPKVSKALNRAAGFCSQYLVPTIRNSSELFPESDESTDFIFGFHSGHSPDTLRKVLEAAQYQVVFLSSRKPKSARAPRGASNVPIELRLDEAVEMWNDEERAAFGREVKASRIPKLLSTDSPEPIDVDRVAILQDIARSVGADPNRIETALFEGALGFCASADERGWPSAEVVALIALDSFSEGRVSPGLDLAFDRLGAVQRLLSYFETRGVREGSVEEIVTAVLLKARRAYAAAMERSHRKLPSLRAPKKRASSLLRDAYGFEFPDEVDGVWELAKSISPKNPENAFALPLELFLVGPFQVLAGLAEGRKLTHSMLLHWRYSSDLPEFFTVVSGPDDGFHMGYVFDEQLGRAGCVAAYYAHDSFEHTIEGVTLLEAIRMRLELAESLIVESLGDEDFRGVKSELRELKGLASLRASLESFSPSGRSERGECYLQRYDPAPQRRRLTLATPEGLGAWVDEKKVSNRNLIDNPNGKGLLTQIIEEHTGDLPRLAKQARRSAKEGFFGDALLVGRTAWQAEENEMAQELLELAYTGLGREGLLKVLRTHAAQRDRPSLSLLED